MAVLRLNSYGCLGPCGGKQASSGAWSQCAYNLSKDYSEQVKKRAPLALRKSHPEWESSSGGRETCMQRPREWPFVLVAKCGGSQSRTIGLNLFICTFGDSRGRAWQRHRPVGWSAVPRLLDEAGLRLTVDVPTEAQPILATLRIKGLRRTEHGKPMSSDAASPVNDAAPLAGSKTSA